MTTLSAEISKNLGLYGRREGEDFTGVATQMFARVLVPVASVSLLTLELFGPLASFSAGKKAIEGHGGCLQAISEREVASSYF